MALGQLDLLCVDLGPVLCLDLVDLLLELLADLRQGALFALLKLLKVGSLRDDLLLEEGLLVLEVSLKLFKLLDGLLQLCLLL